MHQLLRRVAFMVEIASRKQGLQSRLGKTAVQKLLYLLQAGTGVQLGYRFDIYTYGPYDSAVMRDIDYAAWTRMLSVKYEGDMGYEITPGPDAGVLEGYRQAIREEVGEKLERVFAHFGKSSASELELRATVLYVAKDEPSLSDNELIARVSGLKPRFDSAQIAGALEDLRATGLLEAAAGT